MWAAVKYDAYMMCSNLLVLASWLSISPFGEKVGGLILLARRERDSGTAGLTFNTPQWTPTKITICHGRNPRRSTLANSPTFPYYPLYFYCRDSSDSDDVLFIALPAGSFFFHLPFSLITHLQVFSTSSPLKSAQENRDLATSPSTFNPLRPLTCKLSYLTTL